MKARAVVGVVFLITGLLGVGVGLADTSDNDKHTEQVIKINTHKFEFQPNLITLKRGVPVILEFTSSDVIMGFNSPDLKARATIIPGVVTRLRVVPEATGVFTFICDIFCGDGHEEMSGTITVVS